MLGLGGKEKGTSRKHDRPEEIVGRLREADTLLTESAKVIGVVETIGIHKASQ